MTDALFNRFGREFADGDVLFREDEQGNVMYVIQSGVVRISKRVGDEDKTLAMLGAGEFVGEMAILNTKPRTATATVVEGPARCLVIDAQTLETMLKKNTEIALRLVKKLAKRLDAADSLIEILMHRDPKARLLLALLRHAEAFGQTEEDGIRVRTSSAEMAAQVGVDTQTAEDLFARLRRLRLIADAEDGSLVVFDLGRLEDFIEFLEVPQRFGTP